MSIKWKKVSWRYIFEEQTQMYVPVARISRGHNWRRVCVMTVGDAKEPLNEKVKLHLCTKFVSEELKLASTNLNYKEVWLTRERTTSGREQYGLDMFFDNIAEGNCSQYDRTLLVLSRCKGMNTRKSCIATKIISNTCSIDNMSVSEQS